MNEYYRLVIDTLKNAMSEYVSSGEVDMKNIANARQQLNFAIDSKIVDNQPHDELVQLREDLTWLQFDLFNE